MLDISFDGHKNEYSDDKIIDSEKSFVVFDKEKNIDNRKKYAHLLKDHPELNTAK